MTTRAGSLEPVVLVGAGRAGRALAAAFRAAGMQTVLVDRTAIAEQQGVPQYGTRAEAVRAAAVILVAVRDGQLDVALDEIRTVDGAQRGVIILQVSGSAEPAARAAVTDGGMHYGTFHPLLPLLDPALASFRLQGSVVGVEGDAPALEAAMGLAARLGATTIAIPRADRAAYHAAAVIASNFPVTLAALAEQLLARIGVDGVAAHRAVRALMAASVENLASAHTALDALTGPIARGDATTVLAHSAALRGMSPHDDVYAVLSRATVALMEARGDDPAAIAAISAAIDSGGSR